MNADSIAPHACNNERNAMNLMPICNKKDKHLENIICFRKKQFIISQEATSLGHMGEDFVATIAST